MAKYRDRILSAAIRLVDRNRPEAGGIVGDLAFLEEVDCVLAEMSEPTERGDSLMVHVPNATRGDLIAALATMPDEAFNWFVLACRVSAMLHGGHAQIWPDGMGGFSSESRMSVQAVRQAADAYFEASQK